MNNHGLSYHPLFGRWYRMVRRCTNPREAGYKNYGGRGISVCEAWIDPAVYIAYVEQELGPQPSSSYSIDRIDNDGDYEPGNIRWATRSVQCSNQRQRTSPGYPVGITGYKGVKLHKPTGRFAARLHIGGRQISLGYFDSALDAARAYDAAAWQHHGSRARLNFPPAVVV